MVRRWRLAAMVLALWTAIAGGETHRLMLESLVSDDSDDERQTTIAAGYQRIGLLSPEDYVALRAGQRRLEAPQGTTTFDSLRVDLRTPLLPSTALYLRANPLFGDSWSPLLAAGTLSWKPVERLSLEGFAERELVDTVVATNSELLIDTYGASGDWRFHNAWTAALTGFEQRVTDNNQRHGRVARLIFAPPEREWLSVQLRARRVDSERVGVGYFSPRRLEEYDLVARIAGTPFGDHWNLSAQVGAGQQRVNVSRRNPIFLGELKARGWFTEHYGLEARAACTNIGALNTQPAGDGYRYCSMGLNLIGSW